MVAKDLKIEIRPIPNRSGIKQFSENLEYYSQSHIIGPFVNPKTLKYVTGLSKKDKDFLEKEKFPYDLTDNYQKGVSHPFWESSSIKVELKNNPTFLFPGESLIDFIKYKYLLKNSYIYSSEEQMKSGIKSEATHYIYDEKKAINIKATKLEKKNTLLSRLTNLSLSRKRDIILILLNENTDNKNEDYLTVRFDDIITDSKLSIELELLLKDSPEDIKLSATIKSAIQKNVLRRTKKGIFFFENNLGYSEDDVKEFLDKPENQEILLNIKNKIQ